MNLFKSQLLGILVAFGLIIGALVGALLYYVFPQFYPDWYFGIVFFFLIMEVVIMNFVISKSAKVDSKKMVNVYMLTKVVKILVSLVFIAIYALTVKENIKNFVIVFIAFYVLYLFLETALFSKIEKHLKEKKSN